MGLWRSRFRRVAFVAAVGVVLGLLATPASAAPAMSLTVAAWSRSEPQGLLTYDFTFSTGDLTGSDSPCKSYCKYNVSGYYWDGTTYKMVQQFAQNTDWRIYTSFTGRYTGTDAAVREVTHLRAYMWNGSNQTIDSGYVQVATPRTHSLVMDVTNWSRNDTTGLLTYDVTVTGRNLWAESSPCKSYCAYLVALYYPDGTSNVEVHRLKASGGWYVYRALDLRLTATDAKIPEGTLLRAYMWDGSTPAKTIDTGYVQVDVPRTPSVLLTVDRWERRDDGKLDYDVSVDAFNLWARTSICSAYCTYRVEALAADGTVVRTLFNDSLWKYRPSIHDRFQATGVTVGVATQIRVVLRNGSNQTMGNEAPVTDFVIYSLTAETLAPLLEPYLAATATDICMELEGWGPHTNSSLSDAHEACLAGQASGNAMTWARILLRLGPAAVMLVVAGSAGDYPGGGSPPPPPANPDPGGGTGTTGGSGDAPADPPVPAELVDVITERIVANTPNGVLHLQEEPDPEDQATKVRTIAKECVKNVIAARLYFEGRHPCQTLPMFFPGSDVITAAQHDYDAIFVTHSPDDGPANPEWLRLNYLPSAAQTGSRTWYQAATYNCGDPSLGACDEYPFYSSMQGGPNAVPLPSLRRIDAAHNTLEGSRYGTFTQQCLKGVSGAAFLVIPMPYTYAPPTFGVC